MAGNLVHECKNEGYGTFRIYEQERGWRFCPMCGRPLVADKVPKTGPAEKP